MASRIERLVIVSVVLSVVAWAPAIGVGAARSRIGRPFLNNPVWLKIDSPATETHRDCQACCWDPVRDMIYMYGGSPALSDSYTNRCQRFDPATDSWTDMAPMITARGWIKGIYCHGVVYAMGGSANGSPYTDSCEAYDIASNRWSSIAPLPAPDCQYQAVVWQNLIYILGGYGYNQVWFYDVVADTWGTADPMPSVCQEGDACIIGDTIYFAGGEDADGTIDTKMRIGVIDPGDPTHITWSWGADLPAPRYDGPTVALNGNVYWFGGIDVHEHSTADFHVFYPRDDSFGRMPSYPGVGGGGVAGCCLAVTRDPSHEIYALGGEAGGLPAGYYKLAFPGANDVGATRLVSPRSKVDTGDTVTPSGEIYNFGIHPEGFHVLFRIGNSYTSYDSVYLPARESALASFAPWIADCAPGPTIATCSTMLSADDNLSNNAVSDTFKLLTFDAAVSGITIPDSLPAGNCILVAEVTNYSRIPGALWVDCRVLSGDTLPVYVQSESIYITTVSMQWVTLPTWNATPGHYVAKVFAVHNGRVMRDTLRAAFVVFPTGIEQPMEAPPGVWGHRTTATIVRGALTVPFTAYRLPLAACLLDISGCKVLDLKPGANDIRDLAPGVYFVQLPPAANGKRPAITKIIVTE